MSQWNRKRLLIVSITVIVILLMMVTVYSYLTSNHILERASGKKIDFTTHRKVDSDKRPNEEYVLFMNRDDWEDFLNRTYHSEYFSDIYNETQINGLVRTYVNSLNFTSHVYFGAFWGVQPSGGHLLEIRDLVLMGDKLTVFIQRTEPNGMAADVITYPTHIISIQKNDIQSNVTVDVEFIESDNYYWIFLFETIVLLFLLAIFVLDRKRSKKPKEEDRN